MKIADLVAPVFFSLASKCPKYFVCTNSSFSNYLLNFCKIWCLAQDSPNYAIRGHKKVNFIQYPCPTTIGSLWIEEEWANNMAVHQERVKNDMDMDTSRIYFCNTMTNDLSLEETFIQKI